MNVRDCGRARRGRAGRGRRWAVAVVGLLIAWGLSGCAQWPNAQGLGETADAPSVNPSVPPSVNGGDGESEVEDTGLSTELLYDLLLARIAVQRGRNEVAMTSLSRAAHLSRDRRIVAQAIGLAARLEDHQRVIALSDLLTDIAPNNTRHHLLLARAQFATGRGDEALQLLIDLARRQKVGGEGVLKSIATLLTAQSPEESLLPRLLREIDAWPQSPELKLTAALLAAELKQDEVFRELINQALALRPGWEIPAMLKLSDLTDFAPPRMAVYADDFLREFPAAKQFRIHYGRLLMNADQLKKSLAQFEIVLQQDPQSSEALLASGVAYLTQENLPEALERLSESLALNPQDDRARLHIADIKIAQDAFGAAMAVLREVSAPAYYFDVHTRLAFVIAKQHGIEAGIRHLTEIDARTEAEAVRVILAQDLLYRDFDLPERAMTVLDAGLAQMPKHPDLLYNRGLLAAQLNLLALHERDMRALIALQPDNAHAYNALGYTLADQTERLDEALELITRALEMMPNSPYILDSMGWVNFRIGNNDKAIEFLRRALDAQKSAEIAAHLGEALWAAGNRREAGEIWARGKKWEPDNAVLLDTMKRFSRKKSSAVPVSKWMTASLIGAPRPPTPAPATLAL